MKKLRKKVVLMLILFLVALIATAAYGEELPQNVDGIKQRFEKEVGTSIIDASYEQTIVELSMFTLASSKYGAPQTSELFLLVDKNKSRQQAFLAFFDANKKSVEIVGGSKASTGKASRLGSFETPVGVFKNTVHNPSYRALGTKNDKGWRGLGAKGSRVWDLGWQKTKTRKGEDFDIRLLVHATDPDQGEKRLGTQDSQGCIRIPAKFNRFLDYYGILDAEYEKNEKAKWVLLKQREPSRFAGSLVVVIDSGT